MPEIILPRDGDVQAAARELLDLAGDAGMVEVRTGRSGPAFEVDDATYDAWSTRHKGDATDEQLAANDQPGGDDTEVTGDGEVPAAAINADPTDVDLDPTIDSDDEVPEVARNVAPPQNGEAADEPDPDAEADDDQAEQAPRKRTARKATSSTRSRSGSGN
ncbi:hypothetical protein [Micromonospora sp. NPDC049645]|uniref:hypothetical protein n=1 Tax=Micromonospora sp. NPDC049645 TaxID=3155508 RepID=UPI00343C4EF9